MSFEVVITNLAKRARRYVTGSEYGTQGSEIRPIHTQEVDATGKVPGDVGYVGSLVQSSLDDINSNGSLVQTGETTPDGSRAGHVVVVNGDSKLIPVSPTVSLTAYASGDCIGELLTLADAARKNGLGTVLHGLKVGVNSATVYPAMDIMIFNADPSASTIADNEAFVLHADDINKHIATIEVFASNYVLNSKYAADLTNLGQALQAANADTDLYAVVVCKGTPTFAAIGDLSFIFKFLRD